MKIFCLARLKLLGTETFAQAGQQNIDTTYSSLRANSLGRENVLKQLQLSLDEKVGTRERDGRARTEEREHDYPSRSCASEFLLYHALSKQANSYSCESLFMVSIRLNQV